MMNFLIATGIAVGLILAASMVLYAFYAADRADRQEYIPLAEILKADMLQDEVVYFLQADRSLSLLECGQAQPAAENSPINR